MILKRNKVNMRGPSVNGLVENYDENFWDTHKTLTINITSRLSLMPREKNTGPAEPELNDKMLKLPENQIVNI
jgi:hypothetical protein